MTKKIDRRRRYYLVLDVETAGGLDNPLVYDIGYAITDRHGNIYESRSYIINEIWSQTGLMNSAYYANKIPEYRKDLAKGTRKRINFAVMRTEMFKLMREYKVEILAAYNLQFDMGALQNTASHITGKSVKYLTKEFKNIELLCIWGLACQVLYTQKSFESFVVKHNKLTPNKNYKTSAEVGYQFITNNPNFVESHTGLEDVLIEIEIMAYSLRQRKKRKKGILSHPWRIPNRK